MRSDRGTSVREIGARSLFAAVLVVAACGREPREADLGFASPDSARAPSPTSLGVTTVSYEAAYHHRLGQEALDVERWREARDHFALAARADPGFALAHLGLAITSTTPEATARNMDLATRLAAGASEAERLRIEMRAREWDRDFVPHLDLAVRLTELHPTDPRAWLLLARARAALNQVDDSRRALHRAEELEPGFVPVLTALARSYLLESPADPQRAVEFARRSTEASPDSPALHLLLGNLLLVTGAIEGARSAYERAASLAPRSPRAAARLGHMLALEGRYDSARASVDAANAWAIGQERASAGVSRALIHVLADEPQAAVEELFELADSWDTLSVSQEEREEFQVRALTPAARIAMHHGLLTVAGRALERRAELLRRQARRVASTAFRQRQEAEIAYMDALVATHRGDHEGARAEVERYGSLLTGQTNPRKLGRLMEVLGLISLRTGRFAEAVSYLERADLRSSYNRWQLGRAHLGSGNVEAAAALFEDLARTDAESVEFALVGLGAPRTVP